MFFRLLVVLFTLSSCHAKSSKTEKDDKPTESTLPPQDDSEKQNKNSRTGNKSEKKGKDLSKTEKAKASTENKIDEQLQNEAKSALTPGDIILAHQRLRFRLLEKILKKDDKYILRFPGRSSKQHALGTGIAANAWSRTKFGRENPHFHKDMVASLTKQMDALEKAFPGRVSYGWIGDLKFNSSTGDCDAGTQNSSGAPGDPAKKSAPFLIDVWGANAGNFNFESKTPRPFGSGQASCFTHQRPGVFGISTMPPNFSDAQSRDLIKNKLLFDKDKCFELY